MPNGHSLARLREICGGILPPEGDTDDMAMSSGGRFTGNIRGLEHMMRWTVGLPQEVNPKNLSFMIT